MNRSKTATVNLRDHVLVAFEAILTVLALAWLCVGLTDYTFVAKLSKSIRKARPFEKEIEREISGSGQRT